MRLCYKVWYGGFAGGRGQAFVTKRAAVTCFNAMKAEGYESVELQNRRGKVIAEYFDTSRGLPIVDMSTGRFVGYENSPITDPYH